MLQTQVKILVDGYAAHAAKAPLAPFSFERRAVGDNDVLIDIQFCGVCHSDIHQVRDEWGGNLPHGARPRDCGTSKRDWQKSLPL